MSINDTYRHKGLRKKLAEEVRSKGIKDERIIDAIAKIPRHLFMDAVFVKRAYMDEPFPIGKGQTISQPYTVAYQTELLKVGYGDKILEIGTGSGYQACVLAELGARVFSVERHQSLSKKAKAIIHMLGYSVRCIFGDGFLGYERQAPYDKILITAAAPEIPKALLDQLKVGGVMVIPKGKGGIQIMLRITKLGEEEYKTEEFEHFRFVPMLKGKA